jgi:hypothetical protein
MISKKMKIADTMKSMNLTEEALLSRVSSFLMAK